MSGSSKKRASAPARAAQPPPARAKQPSAKKTAARKKPAGKAPAGKAPVGKAPAGKAPARTTAATQSPAKRAPVKRAPAKKTAAKTAPVKKTRPDRTSTPVKTTAPKSPSLDKFLGSQRQALLDERVNYARQAESLRAEADELAAEREPGDVQFDEESGEGDTLAVERERDLALSAQALDAIDAIDRSLAKIDNGTYGICDQCGAAIPRERLRALPHAWLCVRCKSGGLGRR